MIKVLMTEDHWIGPIVRLTIAVVLFPHGAQKLLGWWGGHGFDPTMDFLTAVAGLPYMIAVLVVLAEFFCPILLLFGIGTRIFSFIILVIMAGIIITVQNQHFFMNWFGTQEGEGMEFFLLMIGLCLVSITAGAGNFSMDYFITNKYAKRGRSFLSD